MKTPAVGIKNAPHSPGYSPILQHDETASGPDTPAVRGIGGHPRLAVLRGGARAPGRRKAPPWAETLADLDACCRRKHVKSVQYDNFAAIAAGESRPDAERLFRAMAFSERLQEHNCAQAILRLGGSYTPPVRIVLFGGTTDDNLERSIGYERRNLGERHGAEIGRALRKGNRYAARMLIRASAADLRNAALMERCRSAGSDRAGQLPILRMPGMRQHLRSGAPRLLLSDLPDRPRTVRQVRIAGPRGGFRIQTGFDSQIPRHAKRGTDVRSSLKCHNSIRIRQVRVGKLSTSAFHPVGNSYLLFNENVPICQTYGLYYVSE